MDESEREIFRRKDDYEAGKRAEQISTLQRTVNEIIIELKDHRREEKETWARFEEALDDLKLWRAKMMGIAGIVAIIVSSAWQFLATQFKGR